jgi:hypothetical protein
MRCSSYRAVVSDLPPPWTDYPLFVPLNSLSEQKVGYPDCDEEAVKCVV